VPTYGTSSASATNACAIAQDDAESAKIQWREVADKLRPKVPKLAALMDEAEPDVLAYIGFPADHRVKLHSTNPLERVNGEIKRRKHRNLVAAAKQQPSHPPQASNPRTESQPAPYRYSVGVMINEAWY
jgi:hypothetical protein